MTFKRATQLAVIVVGTISGAYTLKEFGSDMGNLIPFIVKFWAPITVSLCIVIYISLIVYWKTKEVNEYELQKALINEIILPYFLIYKEQDMSMMDMISKNKIDVSRFDKSDLPENVKKLFRVLDNGKRNTEMVDELFPSEKKTT